ncbi:uncharacterized protein [Amphiura filiformis]|uniref:uncharacterized protein n=1 Tax=Amphiura filiformis TaxID=82378 RepID=UPI003B22642F
MLLLSTNQFKTKLHHRMLYVLDKAHAVSAWKMGPSRTTSLKFVHDAIEKGSESAGIATHQWRLIKKKMLYISVMQNEEFRIQILRKEECEKRTLLILTRTVKDHADLDHAHKT